MEIKEIIKRAGVDALGTTIQDLSMDNKGLENFLQEICESNKKYSVVIPGKVFFNRDPSNFTTMDYSTKDIAITYGDYNALMIKDDRFNLRFQPENNDEIKNKRKIEVKRTHSGSRETEIVLADKDSRVSISYNNDNEIYAIREGQYLIEK